MNHILFHVPHSSLKIPKLYWDICIRNINYIQRTNLFLCDCLIDKLIPNKYFNKKEKRLSSIMLEINKRTYLSDKKEFYKLRGCIEEYYNKIKQL